MKILLVSCEADRPDQRAIAKLFEDVIDGTTANEARRMTTFFLDGTPLEVELESSATSSVYRALRKLKIDYEFVD